MPPLLETLVGARLFLRPMGDGDFDALLNGLEDPDRRWAAGYPLDETLISAAMVQESRRSAGDPGFFTQFQIIQRDDEAVVGDLTFLEPPGSDGLALVTFGVAESQRGKGYATESLTLMVDRARERNDICGLRVDTDLVNQASHHVLQSAGLQLAMSDGDRQVYEIRWS